MRCPKCQSMTRVLDTRLPRGERDSAWVKRLLDHGQSVFGWWSDDFRVRRRKCKDCGLRFVTIEVATADLADAFFDAAQNGSGHVARTAPKDSGGDVGRNR